jgi:glycine cleavage system H protein
MALRSAAAQAATLLRLRSSCSQLWVPLARRFSSSQFASSHVEPGLHYAKSHEWVKVDGDVGTVGITAHAQGALGELVYVEIPQVGFKVEANEPFGNVESVKAVSDVNSPVSGEVVEINNDANEDPSLLNSDPYGDGWLIKVKLSDKAELKNLMSSEQYTTYQDEDDH